jgi:hypothetical protein
MNDLDRALTEVFSELADSAPHDPALALRVRQRARARGTARLVGVAAACAVLVAGAAVLEHGRGGSGSTVATSPSPACDGTPRSEILPQWARGGFSDPNPVVPFVRSRSGNVVAILFGGRLWSPPRKDVSNKVLWVWREEPGMASATAGTGGALQMTARLAGTDTVVTTGLPRPAGPSTVDLPQPGCWRITLSWPGGTDTIDLDYARP